MLSTNTLIVIAVVVTVGLMPLLYKAFQVLREVRVTRSSKRFHEWLYVNDIRIAVRFIINPRKEIVFKKVGNPSSAIHVVSVIVRISAKVNGKRAQFDAMYCFSSSNTSTLFWKDYLLTVRNLERVIISDLKDIGVIRVLKVQCLSTADTYIASEKDMDNYFLSNEQLIMNAA